MAAPTNEKAVIVALVLDFETGGLECQECACTQIAIHAIRLDTFETIGRLVEYIYPYNKQTDKGVAKRKVLKSKYDNNEGELMRYDARAEAVSGITMDLLRSAGKDISEVAAHVIDFIKANTISKGRNAKPFFIGQNILFDMGFMQQLMEYGGQMKEFAKVVRGQEDFYGHFQPVYLDTILLGQCALSHLEGMTSYKLEIMAEKLGIELDDAHDADADVTATANIAMVCTQRMRNASGDGGGNELTMTKKEKTRVHFKI
jgi:DNA polymerase III epsilon subunit-like protein